MLNPNIPKTYKALVYDKPGEISTKVVELETPKPGPGEVLLKLYVSPYARFWCVCHAHSSRSSHSGVCHSDLSLLLNSVRTPSCN